MRLPAYIAILIALLVVLFWPRQAAPPADTESLPSTESTPPLEVPAGDGDAVVADDVIPDSSTDVSEFVLDIVPSTLPPPSDQGLLQDLERAGEKLPGIDEIEHDPIVIRPEFAPLLPPVTEEAEPEPEPDP